MCDIVTSLNVTYLVIFLTKPRFSKCNFILCFILITLLWSRGRHSSVITLSDNNFFMSCIMYNFCVMHLNHARVLRLTATAQQYLGLGSDTRLGSQRHLPPSLLHSTIPSFQPPSYPFWAFDRDGGRSRFFLRLRQHSLVIEWSSWFSFNLCGQFSDRSRSLEVGRRSGKRL